MKVDQLLYFVETARRLHVGRAARISHVTPSAVSHAVRSLEEELGRRLFDRIGRRLVLTETGKEYLNLAQAVVKEIGNLKADFLNSSKSWEGSFRIAVANGLGALLIPAWAVVERNHPRIAVEILN